GHAVVFREAAAAGAEGFRFRARLLQAQRPHAGAAAAGAGSARIQMLGAVGDVRRTAARLCRSGRHSAWRVQTNRLTELLDADVPAGAPAFAPVVVPASEPPNVTAGWVGVTTPFFVLVFGSLCTPSVC